MYTYVKCWMRWLEEVGGNCVRDDGVGGSAGSDDDEVGNGDALRVLGRGVPDFALL